MTIDELNQQVKDRFPDKDEWLYSVDGGIKWSQGRPIHGQTRPASFHISPDGAEGCCRFDRDRHDVQAIREKICCDLAVALGLPTPPALLMSGSFSQLPGVINRIPDGIYYPLWKWVELCHVEGQDSSEWKETFDRFYPERMTALDLWVGNQDRFLNMGNFLVIDNGDGLPEILPIDFGLCLGSRTENYWRAGEWRESCIHPERKPVPFWVNLTDNRVQRMRETAAAIADFPREAIDAIVERAALFNRREEEKEFAQIAREALKYRQSRVEKWLKEAA